MDYINDTTATTPAAAVAALRAFGARNIVAIAGGSEKGVSLVPLADALAQHAGRIILLDGAATPRLLELLKERDVSELDESRGERP